MPLNENQLNDLLVRYHAGETSLRIVMSYFDRIDWVRDMSAADRDSLYRTLTLHRQGFFTTGDLLGMFTQGAVEPPSQLVYNEQHDIAEEYGAAGWAPRPPVARGRATRVSSGGSNPCGETALGPVHFSAESIRAAEDERVFGLLDEIARTGFSPVLPEGARIEILELTPSPTKSVWEWLRDPIL